MTTTNSILEISDGTVTFNLLSLNPVGWSEVIPDWKEGGVWQSSPFNDGEVLSIRSFGNVNDAFVFSPKEPDQDLLIAKLRGLVSLLEKAVSYGTSEWAVEPVWIKAQGACETNPIYAIIRGYKMPQLDDPTFDPFAKGAIEGLALGISHDIWQAEQPQTSTCVPISSEQTYHTQTEHSIAVETLGENYAAEYFTGQRQIDDPSTTDWRVNFGVYQNVVYYNKSCALRFYLSIPRRTRIDTAELVVIASGNVAVTDVCVRVTAERGSYVNGEFTTLPILGVTGTELVARQRLAPYVDWTINVAWLALNPYICAGLEDIIQAIIDQPEWTGEGWINIFIENRVELTTAGRYREICTDDSAGGDYPYLTIEFFPEDALYGREETCLDEVILANKHNRAQIDEIWYWDDSAGAIHDVLAGHVFPSVVDLCHVTPAALDWWVFGVGLAGLNDEGPFSNIVLDMYNTIVMPIEGDWSFYDGATHLWIDFAPEEFCDGTNGFSKPGVCVISFIQPGSISGGYMHTNTPAGGVAGLYIRFKITAVPAGVGIPSINNRAPYTACWPYVDIANDSVPGDIAALAKSFLWPKTMCWDVTGEYPYNSFYLAARSLSRGADFSAYINLSNLQNPIGIGVSANAGTVETPDDGSTPWGAPTGAWDLWSAGGVGWVDAVTISFAYSIASQYRGKFAAWLRCVEFNGVFAPSYDVQAKLSYRFGRDTQETDPVPIYQWDTTEESVRYFMGYLDLGPDLAKDELLDHATIDVWLYNDDPAATQEVWLMDLILVPVDEYAVFVDVGDWDPSSAVWPFTSDYAKVDSIELRKTGGTRGHLIRNVYSWMGWGDPPGIAKTIPIYTEGPWRLPNNSQVRVWYFSLHNPYLVVSEQHFINSRYLLSRGDG